MLLKVHLRERERERKKKNRERERDRKEKKRPNNSFGIGAPFFSSTINLCTVLCTIGVSTLINKK